MADAEERERKREERRRRRLEVESNGSHNGPTDIHNGLGVELNSVPDISRETSQGLEQKSDAALPDVVKVPSGLNENWDRPSTPEIDERGFASGKNGYKSYSNAIAAEGAKSGLQKKKNLYANTAISGRRYDSDEDAQFEPEIESPRKKTPPSRPVDDTERDDEWTNLSPQRMSEKSPSNRESWSGERANASEFYTQEELNQIDGRSDSTGSGNQSRKVSNEWKSAIGAPASRGVNKPKSNLKKSDSWIRERPQLPEEPTLKEPEWLDLVRKRRWRSTVKARFPQSERERIQFERRLDTSKKGLKFNPRGEPTGIIGPDMDDELSLYLLQQRRQTQSDDVYSNASVVPSSRSRISSDHSISESDYSESLFDENPRNREYAAEKGILNLSRPPIKGPTKEVHKNLAMERSRQSTMKWRFSIDPQEEPLWAQLPRPVDIEAINAMEGNLEAKFWTSRKKFQKGQFNPPAVHPKPRSRSGSGVSRSTQSSSEVDFEMYPSDSLHSEEMTPTASRSTVRDMKQRLASGDFQTSTPLPQKSVELEQGYLPRLRDLQQKLADKAESSEGKTPKPNYISQEELSSMGSTRRSITEESFIEKREDPKPIEKPRMTRRRSDAELLDLLASRRQEADANAVEMTTEISSLASDFSKTFGKVGDGKQENESQQVEGGGVKEDERQTERTGKVDVQKKQTEEDDKEVERREHEQRKSEQYDSGGPATSPEFLVKLKDSEAFVGTDISFEVVVSGEPSPVVEWYLDDHLIESDKRRKLISQGAVHSLNITDIQLEDEGIYECAATNATGKATCDCELLVDE